MRRASPIAATFILLSRLLVLTSFAGDTASQTTKWAIDYHSVVPLGQDALLLRPGNHVLYFLASAQSIEFEGWREVVERDHTSVLGTDGSPVQRYPRFVDFRVTVSARPKAIPGIEPLPVEWDSRSAEDPNDFLLNLRFRVKIFHALDVNVLEPRVVKPLGMPIDVPYDERIYLLSFDLGEVPLADRIVLEVLTPSGERLTRFHLDM